MTRNSFIIESNKVLWKYKIDSREDLNCVCKGNTKKVKEEKNLSKWSEEIEGKGKENLEGKSICLGYFSSYCFAHILHKFPWVN